VSASAILERLHGVKRIGPGRWLAKCPAHDDKRPSLSISETPDGRILIKDWGGCGTDSILKDLGLDFSALFPERFPGGLHRTDKAPRIPASDILLAVAGEVEVACCAAAEMAAGNVLNVVDHDRLRLAARRLNAACEVANG